MIHPFIPIICMVFQDWFIYRLFNELVGDTIRWFPPTTDINQTMESFCHGYPHGLFPGISYKVLMSFIEERN